VKLNQVPHPNENSDHQTGIVPKSSVEEPETGQIDVLRGQDAQYEANVVGPYDRHSRQQEIGGNEQNDVGIVFESRTYKSKNQTHEVDCPNQRIVVRNVNSPYDPPTDKSYGRYPTQI